MATLGPEESDRCVEVIILSSTDNNIISNLQDVFCLFLRIHIICALSHYINQDAVRLALLRW